MKAATKDYKSLVIGTLKEIDAIVAKRKKWATDAKSANTRSLLYVKRSVQEIFLEPMPEDESNREAVKTYLNIVNTIVNDALISNREEFLSLEHCSIDGKKLVDVLCTFNDKMFKWNKSRIPLDEYIHEVTAFLLLMARLLDSDG